MKVGIKKKSNHCPINTHRKHHICGVYFYFVTHCDCEPTVCETVNMILHQELSYTDHAS